MRNLLWRGLAVALAGCIAWLLWNWPAPAEPVEFDLSECAADELAVFETRRQEWMCIDSATTALMKAGCVAIHETADGPTCSSWQKRVSRQ